MNSKTILGFSTTSIIALVLLIAFGHMFVNQQAFAVNVAGGSPGGSGSIGNVGHLYMGGLPGYPYFGGYPDYGGYPYDSGYGNHYGGWHHHYWW